MSYTQFQILMLFWNMGLVDTFSMLKICLNCGSQYMSIVGTALIGWTCFGVGLISFTTLGGLYLFKRAEDKRWQNQNDGVIIDVSASLSE